MSFDPRDPWKIELSVQDVPQGTLLLQRLSVLEGISELPEIRLVAEMTNTDISPEGLLGKVASVTVSCGEEVLRYFIGTVYEAGAGARSVDDVHGYLELLLVSPLHGLTLTNDMRLFTDKDAPTIVKEVLKQHGLSKVKSRLEGSYEKRAVCTQLGESNYDFIARLLEEEGIFYYFEYTKSGVELTLADSNNGLATLSPDYQYPHNLYAPADDCSIVTGFSAALNYGVNQYTLGDRNWEKPSVALKGDASKKLGEKTLSEDYQFPAHLVEAKSLKFRAKRRLAAELSRRLQSSGASRIASMTPGHKAQLFDLPNTKETNWLVTSVEHYYERGGRSGSSEVLNYTNHFTAQPAKEEYAPQQTIPKPLAAGPHLAIVTGPKGDEIHTDKFGRVRVRFVWDRHSPYDETSSAWVRVSQSHLAQASLLPRVGWEVLVEFEGGDPDRPVVVGRLFNGRYLPPYALPANKTRTVWGTYSSPKGKGHNELRMEDLKDGEHIHVHAQKDYELLADNDRVEAITTAEATDVKNDDALEVTGNDTVVIKQHAERKIHLNEKHEVLGNDDVKVAGDQRLTHHGNYTNKVSGKQDTTVSGGASIFTNKDYSLAVTMDSAETIGGNELSAVGGNLTHKATINHVTSSSGGTMLQVKGDRRVNVGGMSSTKSSAGSVGIRTNGALKSTVGGMLTVTSQGNVQLTSKDAVKLTAGAAITIIASAGIKIKVGNSKVSIANGSIIVDSKKVTSTAKGPQANLAGIIAANLAS